MMGGGAAGRAAALLALAPAPAAAWQRVQTVAELCAEAGARPITRPTLVRGWGRGGAAEHVNAPCTVVVTGGATLRLADLSVWMIGDGGPFAAALTVRLRGGAGLKLLRSHLSAYSTAIEGDAGAPRPRRSTGPVPSCAAARTMIHEEGADFPASREPEPATARGRRPCRSAAS